jgi:hypothetical protein
MQNVVSSSFLFKIKVYGSITLPVVFYRCETWSLALREESKLEMFENRVLCIIFMHMRNEVIEEWIKLHKEKLNDLNSSPNVVGVIKSRKRDGRHMLHIWVKRRIHNFWCLILNEIDRIEDIGVDGRIILRCNFTDWG